MPPATAKQRHLALRLSYFTVGYNLLEGLVSILFAQLAGSPALLGFGVDSFVESLSGGIMIWRFSHSTELSAAEIEKREHRTIRLMAGALFLLAGYVAYESAAMLYRHESPDRSSAGLVIAAISLVVMPILFAMKRRTAASIGSHSLAADAKQTLACILLSAALLVGSGVHYATGVGQADPLAGLVIAGFLLREAYIAWSKRDLCC